MTAVFVLLLLIKRGEVPKSFSASSPVPPIFIDGYRQSKVWSDTRFTTAVHFHFEKQDIGKLETFSKRVLKTS